jgi:hypothetical protein
VRESWNWGPGASSSVFSSRSGRFFTLLQWRNWCHSQGRFRERWRNPGLAEIHEVLASHVIGQSAPATSSTHGHQVSAAMFVVFRSQVCIFRPVTCNQQTLQLIVKWQQDYKSTKASEMRLVCALHLVNSMQAQY